MKQIIDAWSDLKPAVRAMILDMVQSETHAPDVDRRRADVLEALEQAHNDDRTQDRHDQEERP
ncbi:MAG: hypothetical protein KBI32_10240 [Phycisphaerae bacterium]|nr:hypothetical protein [Phycisphaerae bacterium]